MTCEEQVAILTALIQRCSPQLAEAATQVMLKISVPQTVDVLTQIVDKRRKHVHLFAIEKLAELGREAAIPALVNALSSKDKRSYWAAIDAIVKIGQSAIPFLNDAIKSDHPDRKASCRERV